MKHLTNFSNYSFDTDQFNELRTELPAYLKKHDLAGVELLIGYTEETLLPPDNIAGVHLPFWVTWLNIWNEKSGAVENYYPGVPANHIPWMCGGNNKKEMVRSLANLWTRAAATGASYAVIHACHVELTHAFTREYSYSNAEVLSAFAELLNETARQFPGGEPPLTIAIENLWWPGLQFRNSEESLSFMNQLQFNNWSFVLDTGHLLNTEHSHTNELSAIEFLIDQTSIWPEEIIQRIKVIHLCYSSSGLYQQNSVKKGLPVNYSDMNFDERYKTAREHVMKIDEHLPFSCDKINKLIEFISPEFTVHEFIGTIDTKSKYLNIQKAILQ